MMNTVSTTRMSSRGQVVIPDALRKERGWDTGTPIIAIGHGDAVVLCPVTVPDLPDFVPPRGKGRGGSVRPPAKNQAAGKKESAAFFGCLKGRTNGVKLTVKEINEAVAASAAGRKKARA
jgi:bifunctional DNA-binding transcriptional regulator/antitoxin component of YhaV-PrlF toxin-antitoxin module